MFEVFRQYPRSTECAFVIRELAWGRPVPPVHKAGALDCGSKYALCAPIQDYECVSNYGGRVRAGQ